MSIIVAVFIVCVIAYVFYIYSRATATSNMLKTVTKRKTAEDSEAIAEFLSDYIFIDFETTGLNPQKGHRIVQIGAVKYERDGSVSTMDCLVNPDRKIPKAASNIHGITDAHVLNAPTIDKKLPELMNFIGNRTIVGYNVDFDMRFLEHALNYSVPNRVYDMLDHCREGIDGLPNYKLETVAAALGIQYKAHAALGDASATAQIFAKFLHPVSV